MVEREFKRDISSIEEIFDFVQRFTILNNISQTVSYSIHFVVEELFTNMIKYNSSSRKNIVLSLDHSGSEVIIRLSDFDVQPFDITKTEDVDITAPLEERPIGGLGIHLVKKMVDNLDYKYVDGLSQITVIKKLENSDV